MFKENMNINEYVVEANNDSLAVAYNLISKPIQVSLNVIYYFEKRYGSEKALILATQILKLRN